MSDNSTDTSVKDEVLVYVRFCHEGKSEFRLIGVKSVETRDMSHLNNTTSAIMECVMRGGGGSCSLFEQMGGRMAWSGS